MDTIFTLGDGSDENTKLNMDELYERKKQRDLSTLTTYNKILSRIHNRIKTISKQQITDQFCWYIIPGQGGRRGASLGTRRKWRRGILRGVSEGVFITTCYHLRPRRPIRTESIGLRTSPMAML